jgi:hypothetical protein
MLGLGVAAPRAPLAALRFRQDFADENECLKKHHGLTNYALTLSDNTEDLFSAREKIL